MASFDSHEHTYKGVTRLEMEHFRLLASQQRELQGTYDILPEENPQRKTFVIHLSGRKTDDLMQKVYHLANE